MMCFCGRTEVSERCKNCTKEKEETMNCDNCSVFWLHESRYGKFEE